MCWRVHHHVRCSRDAPADARAKLAEELTALIGRGADARRVIEDAELVVSELVTNAVSARCTQADVRIIAHQDRVEISVWDDGRGLPAPRAAGMYDTSGRGLIIVSALASQWGVEPDDDGAKWVWARLPVPRAVTGSVPCQEPLLAG